MRAGGEGKRRRRRFGAARSSRGFALFAVVLLVALLTASVSITLDESVSSIRRAGWARTNEMTQSGLEHGIEAGVRRLQETDAWFLEDPANDWDLFGAPRPIGTEFVGPLPYPAHGPHQNQYRVRVGLRPGQRTRAPSGEDVRTAYGQVVELQVGVEAIRDFMPPTEDRISVGVLLPRSSSHSN